MLRTVIPLFLAAFLALHGLRKKSLSPSGASAAFLVGFGTLHSATAVFGTTLIVFYLTGSRATKYGKQRKAQYEDGYHEAGYRSAWQVLCNASTALVAAFLWNLTYDPQNNVLVRLASISATPRTPVAIYDTRSWCPVLDDPHSTGLTQIFVFAALGHFACCLGDTLASELGILSTSPPRLITTWHTVPRGTNGGVSLGGTIASIIGGLIVALTATVTLLIENTACRAQLFHVAGKLIVFGMLGGFGGSMLDSLLGATIQETRYSESGGKVLTDESKGNHKSKISARGLNILSNNQVNLLSSLVTALISAWLA
ncbi:integral membrane protein DUF92-domain-containing protein [Flagelloscypha sp. PMI_526]|nr:integral membrane protein DUF92-domain-containing protein [Flagelloscypha sp. PMI_526]